MRKKVNKKLIVALLSFVLLFGGTFGSSLAWLLDDADPVTNTFSTSGIEIDLTESEDLDFKMIPGWTIEKDPMVTVKTGSEACYVFVLIEENNNYGTYLEDYTLDSAWTLLEDSNSDDEYLVSGDTADGKFKVYYQTITNSVTETDWTDYVLNGAEHLETCEKEEDEDCNCPNLNGYVTVKEGVTKEQMKEVTSQNPVTLTFTAFATQYWKNNTTPFGEYEAWKAVAPDIAKKS